MDNTISDNGSVNSQAAGGAISQRSISSSSLLQSFQNSREYADLREVDEQSSVLTCSSCGIHLGEDASIPKHVEHSNATGLSSTSIDNGIDEDDDAGNSSIYRRDEEDVLLDLPFSSANISGRVTPLSLVSSFSHGGGGGVDGASGGVGLSGGPPDGLSVANHTVHNFNPISTISGIVLPHGTNVYSIQGSNHCPTATPLNMSMGRFGTNEFASNFVQRNGPSDVTERFNKFDLPAVRSVECKFI